MLELTLRVTVSCRTWFYRDVPKGVDPMMYNFDHPDALDEDLIVETLTHLKQRRVVHLTPYDLTTSTRAVESTTLEPHDVVVLEGILVLYSARVRALLDLKVSATQPTEAAQLSLAVSPCGLSLKILADHSNLPNAPTPRPTQLFVDLDSDIRLSARVIRDTALGRELEAILEQYVTMVKPAFEAWAEPTKKFADLVIPRGSENTRAIELVKEHILSVLTKLDGQMAPSPSMDTLDISPG
jgi:uridine kinase